MSSELILAVIPARGGSKGLPRKNVREVGGRPLIAWTIDAAREAESVERVVVSTDDEEIAGVARKAGAEVPFRRPAELADDETPGIEPVLHAVRWLDREEDYRPDVVSHLQPTSPLRGSGDVDDAYRIFQDRDAPALVSVTEASEPPHWLVARDETGCVREHEITDLSVTRRQETPDLYALNGAIYMAERDFLLSHEGWFSEGSDTYAYPMPTERSLDVDTEWELYLAGLVLEDQTP